MISLSRLLPVVALLVALLSLASFAADKANYDLQQPGLVALKHLNATPRFKTPGADEFPESKALAMACMKFDQRCANYILVNSEEVLKQLPDNPAYWAAFETFAASAPVTGYLGIVLSDEHNEAYTLAHVMRATREWFRYRLPRDGVLQPTAVLAIAQGNRRRMLASSTLIERALYLVCEMSVQEGLGVALAQVAHSGQHSQLAHMHAATRPLATGSLSLREILALELDPARLPEVPDDELTLEQRRYLRAQASSYTAVVEYVGSLSEQSSAAYWDPFRQVLFDWQPEEPAGEVGLANYEPYAHEQQRLSLALAGHRALADIYTGRSSPGVPPQPAPAFFSWDWRAHEQLLCLVPTGDARAGAEEVCVPYFDAAAVAIQTKKRQ